MLQEVIFFRYFSEYISTHHAIYIPVLHVHMNISKYNILASMVEVDGLPATSVA